MMSNIYLIAYVIAGLATAVATMIIFPPVEGFRPPLALRLIAIVVFASLWPILVLLLGFTIVRRCVVAIATLESASIQAAVKQCILSLIVLDAAVCLAVRQPVWWAVGILMLLVPALAVGRWFYST